MVDGIFILIIVMENDRNDLSMESDFKENVRA